MSVRVGGSWGGLGQVLGALLAAIYGRKSTDQAGVSDEQRSVTRQIEHARQYAAQHGWLVREDCIYVDDGISGAEFVKRPGFLRLMNALRPRPPFQVLIMSEESRLGREAIETSYALKQILDAGVRVFYYLEDRERTLDSATDKVMLAVTSYASELERERGQQRTHDALLRKARAGHVTAGRVYGYDNVEVSAPGPDGRPKRQYVTRQINPEQAAVVAVAARLDPQVVDAAVTEARRRLEETDRHRAERRLALEQELRLVRAREQRLAEAIAKGREPDAAPDAVLAALRTEQARRIALEADIAHVREPVASSPRDQQRLEHQLRHRAADVRSLLLRQPPQGRDVLRALLVDRMTFTPVIMAGTRGYRFAGHGSYGGLLAGTTWPTTNGGPNGLPPPLARASTRNPEGGLTVTSPSADGRAGTGRPPPRRKDRGDQKLRRQRPGR
jgi:DNA invertase Pin-like site-specific DNA recombinase